MEYNIDQIDEEIDEAVMKLNSDQLYTLSKAAEHRRSSVEVYSMDADTQRRAWKNEIGIAREAGQYALTQDEWLVDVSAMIDAVQPSAPIYLVAENIDVDALWQDAVVDHEPRIVVWGKLIAFFGNGSCLTYFAGTTKYLRTGNDDLLDASVWPSSALGMLAASQRPAKARPVGTNERYMLARAHYKPRRDFYYVPNVRYETTTAPRHEPRGGRHASPVAHDRSAHKALLTRVSVEALEADDLTARGYTLTWTEELPPEVLDGMTRRGKAPTPGTLNAYRWINKSASRVNADGEQAQRVTLISG